MNVPLICDCGTYLRLGVDEDTGQLVVMCSGCGQVYELKTLKLSPEAVAAIKKHCSDLETGKILSYMCKRVPQ